jgi:hypothetical protein
VNTAFWLIGNCDFLIAVGVGVCFHDRDDLGFILSDLASDFFKYIDKITNNIDKMQI